jgi:hypothetical protein
VTSGKAGALPTINYLDILQGKGPGRPDPFLDTSAPRARKLTAQEKADFEATRTGKDGDIDRLLEKVLPKGDPILRT